MGTSSPCRPWNRNRLLVVIGFPLSTYPSNLNGPQIGLISTFIYVASFWAYGYAFLHLLAAGPAIFAVCYAYHEVLGSTACKDSMRARRMANLVVIISTVMFYGAFLEKSNYDGFGSIASSGIMDRAGILFCLAGLLIFINGRMRRSCE
jgi:hypothetical protein